MSFLDTVRRAKTYLEEQGRVSLGALKLEFDLDDARLECLIDELVDVQQVAAREGKVLSWIGAAPVEASEPEPTTRATPEASSERAVVRQPAEAELRQLTVMFCDLVGSTELAGRLDPEEFRGVVSAYQSACDGPIKRFGGEVAQYQGDGIVVNFGYPQAHEDDAERAVRAGLSIQSAIAELNQQRVTDGDAEIAARVGIHTGPVVVSEMGSEAHRETLALGATSNVAARLEGVAEPGTVVISAVTLRLVQGLFVTRDLGTPALKGVTEALRVYQVVQSSGVRSRLDLARQFTPLIGRDQELGLLLDRWQLAQEGRGRVILISGEAGLGKSRLLRALRERLADRPHTWLESSCSSYTSGSAFQPVLDVLQQALGIDEAQSPEERVAILEQGYANFESIDAAQVVPYLLSLLGLPASKRFPLADISPELQREKSIQALLTPLLASAEIQPIVSVNEDLHWADPSTLEFLGRLIDQVATANMLVVLTFRPQFEPPWPTMSSRVTPMVLSRLTRAQTMEMAEAASGGKLPGALLEKVAARADGVPLFVEELAKSVVDSGVVVAKDDRFELRGRLADLAIPETLQDSLMARLDRLSATKQVAQLAATLGRDFSYELIEAVAETDVPTLRTGLEQLVEAEILYQRGAPPDATYRFKHALLQDTAYQSQLKSTRRALHARVVAVLKERFPERVTAEPETMARHCAEGGLVQQAITHCQRAGERASQASANEEAIGHLRRALELLRTLPETRERDQQELGLQIAIAGPLAAARGWGHPESEGAFERARALVSQIGEVPERARVLVGLAVSFYLKGDLATSFELAKQALEAAERAGGAFELLSAHYAVSAPLYYQGEFSRSLHHLEQAIGLYDFKEHARFAHTMGSDRGVVSRAYAAFCHVALGYPDRGLAMSQEAVALAKRVEHPLSLALALSFATYTHWIRREAGLAQERADEAIALAEEFGLPVYLEMARASRGWARAVAQGGGEAVAEIQQAIAELVRIRAGIGAPNRLAMLAEASWKVGRHDNALGALGLGVARAQETEAHFHDAELYRLRAEILLDQDGGTPEEAGNLLRRALETAREQAAKWFELRAATSLARLLRDQGRRDDARALLQPVYDWFTEGFDTADLKDAKALLEELN